METVGTAWSSYLLKKSKAYNTNYMREEKEKFKGAGRSPFEKRLTAECNCWIDNCPELEAEKDCPKHKFKYE